MPVESQPGELTTFPLECLSCCTCNGVRTCHFSSTNSGVPSPSGVGGRGCVESLTEPLTSIKNHRDRLQKFVKDLSRNQKPLLLSLIFFFILGFIYVQFVKFAGQ